MNALSLIKTLFLLIGSGLLGGGFYWYQLISDDIQEATHTEGRVIDFETRFSDGTTFHYPMIEFFTHAGEAIRFTASIGSSPPAYDKGEKVGVLYTLERPQDAKIDSFFSLWFGPIILVGIGSVFFLFSVLFFLIFKADKPLRPRTVERFDR
jgi:hypothetical protein